MKRIALVVAIGCLSSFSSAQRTGTDPFDLVFVGGRVVDGTGAPWFEADVDVRRGSTIGPNRSPEIPSRRVLERQSSIGGVQSQAGIFLTVQK